MPNVTCTIPRSLEIALDRYIERTKQSASAVVTVALSQFLKHPLHTLFQVSTSGALVRGVYQRAVSVEVLKQHGDFGLGTFDDLDGEMAVLEGRVYQARADGTVREVPDSATAPFAVITSFEPDARGQITGVGNLSELVARCDQYRESNNLFLRSASMVILIMFTPGQCGQQTSLWLKQQRSSGNSGFTKMMGPSSEYGLRPSQVLSAYPGITFIFFPPIARRVVICSTAADATLRCRLKD